MGEYITVLLSTFGCMAIGLGLPIYFSFKNHEFHQKWQNLSSYFDLEHSVSGTKFKENNILEGSIRGVYFHATIGREIVVEAPWKSLPDAQFSLAYGSKETRGLTISIHGKPYQTGDTSFDEVFEIHADQHDALRCLTPQVRAALLALSQHTDSIFMNAHELRWSVATQKANTEEAFGELLELHKQVLQAVEQTRHSFLAPFDSETSSNQTTEDQFTTVSAQNSLRKKQIQTNN